MQTAATTLRPHDDPAIASQMGCPFFSAGKSQCQEVYEQETTFKSSVRCESKFQACFFYFQQLNSFRQKLSSRRMSTPKVNALANVGPVRRAA